VLRMWAARGAVKLNPCRTAAPIVRSLIPAQLDRLPWTRFHTRLIMALGAAWILDGGAGHGRLSLTLWKETRWRSRSESRTKSAGW
jgi:hypothetical protein